MIVLKINFGFKTFKELNNFLNLSMGIAFLFFNFVLQNQTFERHP